MSPAAEATVTMCPLPRATMAGRNALVVQNRASVFTLKVHSICASVNAR